MNIWVTAVMNVNLLLVATYCNCKKEKYLKTTYGKLEVQVLRDLEGSFEPQLVKKR